jgi:hypothetical protein
MVTFGSGDGVGEGVSVSQVGGVGVSVLLSNHCTLAESWTWLVHELGRTVPKDQPLPAKT